MEWGILKYHLLAFIVVCALVWGGCQEINNSEVQDELGTVRTDRLEFTGYGKLVDTLHLGESFYSYAIMYDKESNKEFAVVWFSKTGAPNVMYLGKVEEE